MRVEQIYEIMNDVTKEVLGEDAIFEEDLSNIVDIGTEIFNASAVDNYVRSLINRIGKTIFVNRPYAGAAPSVLMDSWEFGSVCQKITAELPEATVNESWELVDGASYDPNIFYKPTVSSKFFNKKVTFEVPFSFTERQVKESFTNASDLNAFLSMLYNEVEKSLTVKIDSLVMRVINNMVGETVLSEYGNSAISSKSGVRAINLLYKYNQAEGTSLTADSAIRDPEFIRFAAYEMGLVQGRLGRISTLFNSGGKARFTPNDMLHVITLSEFKRAAGVYLQSDVFHETFTALPASEEVPYWQGSGKDYGFDSTGTIDIKTASGQAITVTGVLGVMFDRDALGVTNLDRRVTTNFNPKAEFWNNWYKFEAGYYNDLNENFVVFFIA